MLTDMVFITSAQVHRLSGRRAKDLRLARHYKRVAVSGALHLPISAFRSSFRQMTALLVRQCANPSLSRIRI